MQNPESRSSYSTLVQKLMLADPQSSFSKSHNNPALLDLLSLIGKHAPTFLPRRTQIPGELLWQKRNSPWMVKVNTFSDSIRVIVNVTGPRLDVSTLLMGDGLPNVVWIIPFVITALSNQQNLRLIPLLVRPEDFEKVLAEAARQVNMLETIIEGNNLANDDSWAHLQRYITPHKHLISTVSSAAEDVGVHLRPTS
ncbi:MAG: hypothetical protein JNJ45_11735 [Chthonomonas sp.]|nr:hypothetical protein [Chthonomonas sp.]